MQVNPSHPQVLCLSPASRSPEVARRARCRLKFPRNLDYALARKKRPRGRTGPAAGFSAELQPRTDNGRPNGPTLERAVPGLPTRALVFLSLLILQSNRISSGKDGGNKGEREQCFNHDAILSERRAASDRRADLCAGPCTANAIWPSRLQA